MSSPSPGMVAARTTIRLGARRLLARRVDLAVHGLEHVPASGPVLVAAHHVHHLYDGCALSATLPRPVHILVALDWVDAPWRRWLMEWACHQARWPVVLRTDALALRAGRSAYHEGEAGRYLRRAVREAVALLRSGALLVVFPEAYPAIDPTYTPKPRADTLLPFRAGCVRLVELAERDGRTRVPIVPAGFAYLPGPRWRVTLRFGAPLTLSDGLSRAALVNLLQAHVRHLSAPADAHPSLPLEVSQT